MATGQRIFVVALLLSLLAHLVVAGSSSHWWTPPAHEISFPIEAHLQLPPPPVPLVPAVKAPTSPPKTVAQVAPPLAKPIAEPAVQAEAEPVVLAQAEPASVLAPRLASKPSPELAESVVAPVLPANDGVNAAPEALPEPSPEVISDASPARPLRNLPQQIALRYGVQSGEDGFTLGESIYSGWIRGGRYSLSSVTEATGVTAFFVRGKIVQRSEGSIGLEGMQPERFWGEKGGNIQRPVRFNWPSKLLELPAGSVELPARTQDLLSFAFHLAMSVKETDAAWTLPVTNGKKLRNYQFQIVGRESLNLGEHRVETLRVQGSRAGEGSLDVWLAESRHGLPVKIRTLDQKGKAIVLTLLEDGA